MSRHTRHECSNPLFQIEILDFSKKNGHGHDFRFALDIINSAKVKRVDMALRAPQKTLFKRFKHYKAAISWASRIGSVISCREVDVSPYLNNIEHLNLHQEPLEIEIDKQEFELGKDFVITRSGLTVGELTIDK